MPSTWQRQTSKARKAHKHASTLFKRIEFLSVTQRMYKIRIQDFLAVRSVSVKWYKKSSRKYVKTVIILSCLINFWFTVILISEVSPHVLVLVRSIYLSTQPQSLKDNLISVSSFCFWYPLDLLLKWIFTDNTTNIIGVWAGKHTEVYSVYATCQVLSYYFVRSNHAIRFIWNLCYIFWESP